MCNTKQTNLMTVQAHRDVSLPLRKVYTEFVHLNAINISSYCRSSINSGIGFTFGGFFPSL